MDSILPFGGDGALGVVLDDAEAGGRRDALRRCEEDGHSGAGEGEAEQYAEFCRFVSLSVKPNNSLYAPYLRSPFALGLWVYNWDIKREKGLKWWLYRKLAKEPVLISDVQPELRLKMVENNMKDFGFYGTRLSYEVIPKKRNPKKAHISYRVELPEPFRYGSIELWEWLPAMDSIIRPSMPFFRS